MAKGVISAKYLYDIAEAIRVKSGSQSTITPTQMAAAIAEIDGTLSGSITPSTSTDKGLVTNSIMSGIADAIRAKLDVQEQYTPAQMADAILSIQPLGPTVVSWATGTDAQIAAMVAALDDGTLSIANTGWQIGDERVVALGAMEATGVSESHAAQNAIFVLMDSQHFDLTTQTSGGDTKDHFVVGLKNCLAEAGSMCNNPSSFDDKRWFGCTRRTWCNEVFRAAIPETLRACFKQFKCVSSKVAGSSVEITNDYFALFAEGEIIGYRQYSDSKEAEAVTQIEYYQTSGNRTKYMAGSASAWLERGVWASNPNNFCCMTNSGTPSYTANTNERGLAPFGCI